LAGETKARTSSSSLIALLDDSVNAVAPLSVWLHLFHGAGHEKWRGE